MAHGASDAYIRLSREDSPLALPRVHADALAL